MTSMLQKAILIAEEAHKNQVDKGGNPYIEHPKRVMNSVIHLGEDYAIVAILHDVVEDTSWTFKDLINEGFSELVIDGLKSVTRNPEETYREFVKRAKKHIIGRPVKIEDILDNLDISRLGRILTKNDESRIKRYREGLEELTTDVV